MTGGNLKLYKARGNSPVLGRGGDGVEVGQIKMDKHEAT